VVQETLAQTALLARDNRDPKLGELSRSLQQTRQELAQLTLHPPQDGQLQQRQRRLDELNQREQDLAKQLRQAGGADADETWLELDTLRKTLPADAVLIELARFDVFDIKAKERSKRWQPARYAAWVITAAGPVCLLDLGPADTIDAAVQQVRQVLQEAPKTIRLKGEADAETAVREPLEALAKKVLHPLLPHLGKAQRWIISPDGSLWLVPWAALPLPDGKYAVENHTLSYAISGRELLDAASAKVKVTAPLVLADPDFDLGLDKVALATRRLLREQEAPAETRGLSQALRLGNIKRLPGTASEAQAITAKLRQYAGTTPRVYTDQEASTGVFQAARNPKVVVLSTHGYFLPDQESDPKERDRLGPGKGQPRGLKLENPLLRCGLLLAGCNNADKAKEGTDNGVLTGLQIVGTDLRGCELVVLSACETGLGEVRNGEGVAGLRQAFQLAGAQSVVATLWQVPDQQTAQLMTGFFENLATKQDKATALRNTQLKLIQARRDRTAAAHPYLWAAFTVTGR
jgi:CHAT domain-containing protein